MPIYNYKIRDEAGNIKKGVVEAPSDKSAEDTLQEKGFTILFLAEREQVSPMSLSIKLFSGVSKEEIAMFTRQLSVMIGATVPLVKAFRILVKQQKKITFKVILSDATDQIDGGVKLSKALAKYPKVFDNFYIHMIKSGETTGRLEEVLNYLADQRERDIILMKKVRNALIYPIFILVGIVAVSVIMMIFVIPKLVEILVSEKMETPWPTKVLIFSSSLFQNWWWLMIILLFALYMLYYLAKRSNYFLKKIDTFKFRIPVFGKLHQKICLTRFSENFATLLTSGVPVSRALEIVSELIGNELYRSLILQTIEEVEAGNSISTVFVSNKNIPLILNQVLIVGEETGRMDKVLEKLGSYYSKEVDTTIDSLVNTIEPIMLLILGVGVGILVSGIILPMYSVVGSM